MDVIDSIIRSGRELSKEELIDVLLPVTNSPSTLQNIQDRLHRVRDHIEISQRRSSDNFDSNLDSIACERIQQLQRSLQSIQLDSMKLQCDIAFTKEQYELVRSISNKPVIKERLELLDEEKRLEESIQQLKFEPVKLFFKKFADHLSKTVSTCQRICSQQASEYLQYFDWTQYHQSLLLLRACGKAMIDVDKFEKLYGSDVNLVGFSFRQPLNEIDYNNFVELHETYSIENQLVVISKDNRAQEFGLFLEQVHQQLNLESNQLVVLKSAYSQLKETTTDCCKLLIGLNMNYIETHLTDGINIDKLNGGDSSLLSVAEDQTLPLYALSPQEYITQIGQHLLTLRKQTEQFDVGRNEPLKFALVHLKEIQEISMDLESCQSVTEIVTRCIARHCIRSLLGRTNQSIVMKLTENGRRQLATDALYLDNVLEDLHLLNPDEPNVVKFKKLLMQP